MTKTAYLTARGYDGKERTYETTDYAEVYQFKRICKDNNLPFVVRYQKVNRSPRHFYQNLQSKIANVFN